jgi:predicted nucleic acid-binding protein
VGRDGAPAWGCKAVIDTNVLIDFLDSGRPEHQTAVDLLAALIDSGADVCLPASALTDVYDVVRRTAGDLTARRAVATLVETVTVLTVDAEICRTALASDEPDFEDGVVRACAESIGAHWLVTRDQAAFAHSTAPPTSPGELLARLSVQSCH